MAKYLVFSVECYDPYALHNTVGVAYLWDGFFTDIRHDFEIFHFYDRLERADFGSLTDYYGGISDACPDFLNDLLGGREWAIVSREALQELAANRDYAVWTNTNYLRLYKDGTLTFAATFGDLALLEITSPLFTLDELEAAWNV